jgi:hypothetical protein
VGEAVVPARVSGAAAPVGGRALFCLGLPQPQGGKRTTSGLCATGEALVYAAMRRLMARRFARARWFSESLWKGGPSEIGDPLLLPQEHTSGYVLVCDDRYRETALRNATHSHHKPASLGRRVARIFHCEPRLSAREDRT